MNERLVYGKSGYKGIVGLEVDNEITELFVQDEVGKVNSVFVPNYYWILSNEQIDKRFVRLSGGLHYQWGKQFTSIKDFQISKRKWKDKYDIYAIGNKKEACMVKDGYTYFRGLNPKDVSLLSFDIETTGLDPNAKDAFVVCISTTFRSSSGKIIKKLFSYDEYPSQKEMIDDFCTHFRLCDPSIVLGHNIIPYDFPYLNAAAKRSGTTLTLGRGNKEIDFNTFYKSKFRVDGNRTLEFDNIKIFGREIVDTYFLAQKYDFMKTFEGYGLKPLIKQLKLDDPNRVYYDAAQIRYNYKDPVELQKIKQYCIDDSDDPIKLWDLMGPLYFHMAPMIPKSFQELILTASGSQINSLLTRAYLQDGHSIPKYDPVEKFEGAYSWGKPGIYKNVLKADCQAMYPSIIIQYNVFDPDKDPKGYLLELTKTFKEKRLEYKKLAIETGLKMYVDQDNAAKSILNSFYGFLATNKLNFNCPQAAAFITGKGREILSTAITWATGQKFEDLAPEYFVKEEIEIEEVQNE